MSGIQLLFYMLSGVLIASSLFVVVTKNTVYRVLFLIMAFLNAGGLFLLAGAEFVSMVLIIVYVGAVAVLFLFVVMMLDLKNQEWQGHLTKHAKLALAAAMIFMIELVLFAKNWNTSSQAYEIVSFPTPEKISNTQAIASVLYTHYFYIFQIAGLILLVAIVGAITLALNPKKRKYSRYQDVKKQQQRDPKTSVVLADVPTGHGVTPGEIYIKNSRDLP
jgi:NADH-quinone oxidoreductase subunit J